MPGVVLLDTAATVVQARLPAGAALRTVANVKFLAVVRPDEALSIEAQLDDASTHGCRARFTIRRAERADEVVATGALHFSW